MTMGERIRLARERAKLSQADLARALNSSRGVVHGWESDRNRPENMLGLAKVLGVSISWIYGETPDPRPAPAWFGEAEELARTEQALQHLEVAVKILRGEGLAE